MNNGKNFEEYQITAAANGYPFLCSCGEMYRSSVSAIACHKCYTYLDHSDYMSREVVLVPTGEIVWSARGEKRIEEYRAAQLHEEEERLERELEAAHAPLTHNPFSGIC